MKLCGYIFILFILMLASCSWLTEPSKKEDRQEQQLEWPSINQNAAWPMWGHDPQWTYRSQYVGPSNPDTHHVYLHPTGKMAEGGFVIGPNDEVYYTTEHDSLLADSLGSSLGIVTKLDAEFNVEWHRPAAYDYSYNGIVVFPVFLQHSLAVLGSDFSLTEFSPAGEVLQRRSIEHIGQWSIQVDPAGNYYLADGRGVSSYTPDGALRWYNDSPKLRPGGPGPMSPDGTQFYPWGDHSRYALDTETGEILWTFPGKGWASVNNAGTIFTTTYTGIDSGTVVALNPDGTVQWETPLLINGYSYQSCSTNIAISPRGNLIFNVWSRKGPQLLIAISGATGELQWTYQPVSPIHSGVIIDADGNSYFDLLNGEIVSLTSDGEFRWRKAVLPVSSLATEVMTFLNSQDTLVVGFVREQVYQGLIALN